MHVLSVFFSGIWNFTSILLQRYLISFIIIIMEKKNTGGLDLIVIIVVAHHLPRLIGSLQSPVEMQTLMQIGEY